MRCWRLMVTLPASWPGDNEEKQKIKMTTPVAMRIRTEPVFAKTTNNYTIAFWVPEILQVHAHAPRAPVSGCRHDFDPVPDRQRISSVPQRSVP
jgi:SOUL heme-binding protein